MVRILNNSKAESVQTSSGVQKGLSPDLRNRTCPDSRTWPPRVLVDIRAQNGK